MTSITLIDQMLTDTSSITTDDNLAVGVDKVTLGMIMINNVDWTKIESHQTLRLNLLLIDLGEQYPGKIFEP